MITIREIDSLESVRALCEGRAPKRHLHTVPFLAFRAPLARADFAVEDIIPIPVPLNRHTKRGYQHFAPYLESFRATNPGEFRTADFISHARLAGWCGDNTAFNNILQKRKENGELIVVRNEGKFVIWKFAESKVQS